MSDLETALARIRGGVPAKNHNARTISALTSNPGCRRRGLMDAAGVDKARLAAHIGFPAQFGQSQFAITRGNAFEAQVKADGCAELLTLLRDKLGLALPEVSYDDLEAVGGNSNQDLRHNRTRRLLAAAATNSDGAGTLFDHPMLKLDVAGHRVFLEPDLIAFQLKGQFHVIEIKSFPVIDGQADGGKVAAAATQSAVYVLAMRALLAEHSHPESSVAHDVILVCPENFSNRPTATFVDVRKQLSVLRRQLSRLARVRSLVDSLPGSLSLSLEIDAAGVATRGGDSVAADLSMIEARYAPECLESCELARFCRHEARGCTHAMGRTVREDLGGVEYAATALGLARGTVQPSPEQAEATALLQLAWTLRSECLGQAA